MKHNKMKNRNTQDDQIKKEAGVPDKTTVPKEKKAKKPLLWILNSLLGLLLAGCSFSPEQNIEADVYGPPEEYYEEPAEAGEIVTPGPTASENETEEELELEFDAEMNEEICIYGPPEMFD